MPMNRPDQACLAALAEFSTEAMMLATAEGVVTWASPSTLEVFGIEPETLAGTTVRDLVAPDDVPTWCAALEQLMQDPGAAYALTLRCRHQDGGLRWTQCVGRSLLADPTVHALLITFRDVTPVRVIEAALQASEVRYRELFDDITQRQRTVEALRAAEAKYRSLVEHAVFGVFIMQGERVVFVNPRGAELTGYSADELMAMPSILSLVPESDRPRVYEQIRSLETGEPTVQFVARGNRKDGTLWLAEITSIMSDYGGAPAVFSTVTDISDRLRLEEQLRQAQKMEAVGRLAGGIAHDFNNLLTAIRGNAELMQYRVRGDPGFAAEVAEVLKAADRAATLTRQLLAFSRKQEFTSVTLQLNDVVDNVTRMTGRIIGPNVQLETRRRRSLRPVVADPAQLEQVLLNLILNARDALPDGGHIIVRTANVDIDESSPEAVTTGLPPGPYVLLQVRDDGIGMDQPTQARIFEPFFTTKEPGRGTGLGLSTVYGNVRQMGGAVVVESARNRGATFSVYVPAAPVDMMAPDQSSSTTQEA
jgi:two-component system, cell cycle sensor histidine kinase and response regulator CckA